MDLRLAYGIMGLQPDASLDHAKKAYRARAVLLHPDRVEGTLRADADSAMAQLNEAWDTVRAHLQQARSPTTSGWESQPARETQAPVPQRRPPKWGECEMCGCSPALPLFQRRIVGALLFWRTAANAPSLCRICGRSFHTETQAQCMTKGWWGVFAFYANLVTLVVNMVRASRHQQALTEPEYRDPAVVTAVNRPVHTRPLRKRPVPILASIVALSLWVWLASVQGGNDTSPSSPTTTTTGVGTCLTAAGRVVDCASVESTFRLTGEAYSPDDCAGDAFQDPSTQKWYCSVKVR